MTDALWYFARGTGLVSLVLLTVVVALGIGARSGRTAAGLPRFAVSMLHRNAALMAVIMLIGHVLSLLFDPYAQLRLFDIVVPFVGSYRPVWQGLGTLAFDLVLALIATSLLRHRLGARTWRVVHWLAYLCWPIALLHGLQTGTDGGTWWLRTVASLCAAVVVAALVWRLSPSFTRFRSASRAASVSSRRSDDQHRADPGPARAAAAGRPRRRPPGQSPRRLRPAAGARRRPAHRAAAGSRADRPRRRRLPGLAQAGRGGERRTGRRGGQRGRG